jgi:membrane protease YdiL (CAAX protease family)
VQLRCYVVAPPLILLLYVRLIYGLAPLPPLGPYWISTSFVPTLVIMVLFNNLPEEIGWTGFAFARLQDCHGAGPLDACRGLPALTASNSSSRLTMPTSL